MAVPANGDTLSGIVEVVGTANIENFAFYKLEYISLVPGAVWRAVWLAQRRSWKGRWGPGTHRWLSRATTRSDSW